MIWLSAYQIICSVEGDCQIIYLLAFWLNSEDSSRWAEVNHLRIQIDFALILNSGIEILHASNVWLTFSKVDWDRIRGFNFQVESSVRRQTEVGWLLIMW